MTFPTLAATLLTMLALPSALAAETFTGTITDSMCSDADHSPMRMGPTDAECTTACVGAHDAEYVLSDGTNVFVLSDQRTPEQFAGQKVTVTGTLNTTTKTIQVESITPAGR